jgi:hypothetical protein
MAPPSPTREAPVMLAASLIRTPKAAHPDGAACVSIFAAAILAR